MAAKNGVRQAPTGMDARATRSMAVRRLAKHVQQGITRSTGNNMLIPLKHSIAVVIRNGDKVLSTRRPDNDDELPGIWGLPAGSLRNEETIEALIARIGRDKLGVELAPLRKLESGRQMRSQYL